MKKVISFMLMVAIVLVQIAFVATVSADSTYTLDYEAVEANGAYTLTVKGFKVHPTAEYHLTIPDTAAFDADASGEIEDDEQNLPVTKIAAGAFKEGYDSKGRYEEYGKKVDSVTVVNDLMTGLTIGANVKAIGDAGASNNVFTYLRNSKFTTLTIPDNVEVLGKHSFTQSYFTNVYIGRGVTSLEFATLQRCNKLTEITTYASYFGSVGAFDICKAVERINLMAQDITKLDEKFNTSADSDILVCYVSSANVAQKLLKAGYTEEHIMYPVNEYTFSVPAGENSALSYTVSNKTAVLNGFDVSGNYILPKEMDLVIPQTVTDSATGLSYTVTEIAPGAFAKTTYADYAKDNLSDVIDGNYIYVIKSVVIPSTVTTIGASAFDSNEGLEYAVIPDSVTYMGTGIFKNCRFMTSVELGDGITSLPGNTFNNCQRLKKLIIPSTVGSIALSAITAANSLECVVILGENVSFTGAIQSGKNAKNGTVFYVKNEAIKKAVESCDTMSTDTTKYFQKAVIIGSETGTPLLSYADGAVKFSTPKYLDSYTVIIAQYSDSENLCMESVNVYSDEVIASGEYTFNVDYTEGKVYKAFVFENLVNIKPLANNIDF